MMDQLEYNHNGAVVVYVDGACSDNGQNGASAGIGVYWGERHPDNVSEPLNGRQTSNRAELNAAITALEIASKVRQYPRVHIVTDSEYLYLGITERIGNWIQNGWRNQKNRPLANQHDWRTLLELIDCFEHVSWDWVEAHAGIYGNEMADRFARQAIARRNNF